MLIEKNKKALSASAWAFEENIGQYSEDIKFVLYKGRYVFIFKNFKVLIGIRYKSDSVGEELYFFEMELQCENKDTFVIGEDKKQWVRKYIGGEVYVAEIYGRIRYKNIFNGIDLVFYIMNGELEFDFVCYPRSNIQEIGLIFSGIDNMELNSGNIDISVNKEVFKLLKPNTLQEICNEAISSEYEIDNNLVKFKIGNYDRSVTLVIDPVIISSTYMGLTEAEVLQSSAVDKKNNYYGIGTACSIALLVESVELGKQYLRYVLFLLKMNAEEELEYFVYIMGEYWFEKLSLIVDENNKIYFSAVTTIETVLSLEVKNRTVVGEKSYGLSVLNLDMIKNEITYLNYIGLPQSNEVGSSYPNSIALNKNGSVFVTGVGAEGNSWNRIIPSNQYNESGNDFKSESAFLYKLSKEGKLLYFQLLTLGENSEGNKVKIYNEAEVYIAGNCEGSIKGDLKVDNYGAVIGKNIFVAYYNEADEKWRNISLIGGSDADLYGDMDIDRNGNIYVVGRTSSYDFQVYPKGNEFGEGEKALFIIKLNKVEKKLEYSMRVRDNFNYNPCIYLCVNKDNRVYITGYTEADNYPLVGGFNEVKVSCNGGFITCINEDGLKLEFSSYLPGGDFISPFSIASGINGEIFISGLTNTKDLPVINSWQEIKGGQIDTFILKLKNNIDLNLNGSYENVKKEKVLDEYEFNKQLTVEDLNETQELKLKIKNLEDKIALISKNIFNRTKESEKSWYYITTDVVKLMSLSSKVYIKVTNSDESIQTIDLKVRTYKNLARKFYNEESKSIIFNTGETRNIVLSDLTLVIEVEVYSRSCKILINVVEENTVRGKVLSRNIAIKKVRV